MEKSFFSYGVLKYHPHPIFYKCPYIPCKLQHATMHIFSLSSLLHREKHWFTRNGQALWPVFRKTKFWLYHENCQCFDYLAIWAKHFCKNGLIVFWLIILVWGLLLLLFTFDCSCVPALSYLQKTSPFKSNFSFFTYYFLFLKINLVSRKLQMPQWNE